MLARLNGVAGPSAGASEPRARDHGSACEGWTVRYGSQRSIKLISERVMGLPQYTAGSRHRSHRILYDGPVTMCRGVDRRSRTSSAFYS